MYFPQILILRLHKLYHYIIAQILFVIYHVFYQDSNHILLTDKRFPSKYVDITSYRTKHPCFRWSLARWFSIYPWRSNKKSIAKYNSSSSAPSNPKTSPKLDKKVSPSSPLAVANLEYYLRIRPSIIASILIILLF